MSRKTSGGSKHFLAVAQLNCITNRFEGCSDWWPLRELQKCYCFPYIAAYIHYPKFSYIGHTNKIQGSNETIKPVVHY